MGGDQVRRAEDPDVHGVLGDGPGDLPVQGELLGLVAAPLGLSEKASQGIFDLVGFPGGAVAMMGYRVLMFAGVLVSLTFYALNARRIRVVRSAGAPEPESIAARGPEIG